MFKVNNKNTRATSMIGCVLDEYQNSPRTSYQRILCLDISHLRTSDSINELRRQKTPRAVDEKDAHYEM